MSNNHKKVKSMLKDFYPYAKKTFGFDRAAKIVLNPDQENSKKPLGKTAFYDPQNYSVTVYTHNRHPKDIMRSISHELVHHTQNCRGDLTSVAGEQGPGYAQNNDHLREMEREAYEQGNLCFRDWEDGIKSNLEPGTIYEKRRTTNMATVKEHLKQRDALRVQKLFEKFGYKAPMSEDWQDDPMGGVSGEDAESMETLLRDTIEDILEMEGTSIGAIQSTMQLSRLVGQVLRQPGIEEAGYDEDDVMMTVGEMQQEKAGGGAIDRGYMEEPEDGYGSPTHYQESQSREDYQVGDWIKVIGGGLRGATGKVIELTSLVTGEPGLVVLLDNDADKQVFGKAGDEVIVGMDQVQPPVGQQRDGGVSDEERRAMYDDEHLSDYDDIREKKYKREDEEDKLSDEQSDEMDKDKDGDIDGEDLKALRKNESLKEALRDTFRKNPKLIKMLQESGLSNNQIIKKVLEYGDHQTQAQGGMVSSSQSSDPELDQIADIVRTVIEGGGSLHDLKQPLEAEAFDVQATNRFIIVKTTNGDVGIASAKNVELAGDEELIDTPYGQLAVGRINQGMEEGFRGSPEEKEMTDKMSNKEFYRYHTRDKHVVPDLKGDMGPMDGMEGPFQFKSGAVLYYDPKAGKYYDRGKDMYLDNEEASRLTMEQEEQEDQAGSGDEVAAAKEKGMKSDVQRVAKFMFNHKQLGPALEKLKGDNVEVAQLLALLSQEMGVDPSDLGTLVTKVKGAMKEAEGEVFATGDKVVDDRNGQTGTVTEPMAGGAVIKLDDGEIVKVRDKFLSKVEPTVMKELGEEDEEATTYSDLTRGQIDMIAASLSENSKKPVKEYGYDDEDPYSDVYDDPEMAGLEAEFPWMKDKKPQRGLKKADPEEIAAMQAALADVEAEYSATEFDDDDDGLDEMVDGDGEYANIGIKTTQDEYGALHILPGVRFTGDIAADVKQCQQNDELDSWLYGELGSDENITDAAGEIVYAGADVQDFVGGEEDYDGSYQPRMGEGFGFTTDPLQEWWDIRNDRKANKFFEWAVKKK